MVEPKPTLSDEEEAHLKRVDAEEDYLLENAESAILIEGKEDGVAEVIVRPLTKPVMEEPLAVRSNAEIEVIQQGNSTLTPAEAAQVDWASKNDEYIPEEVLDAYHDFIFSGNEGNLRKFVKERSKFGDDYHPSTDCRNPDISEKKYSINCT